MRRKLWATTALMTLLPITAHTQTVITENETCESNSHLDIASLEATYDSTSRTISAVLKTCGPVNPNSNGTRYFLYADYLKPTIVDQDRDGDLVVGGDEADDACAETADSVFSWGGSEPSPEAYLDPADPTAMTIRFEVDAASLPVEVQKLYLWAAAGNFQGGRGVIDRAPNTDRKDKCDKPQNEDEALVLTLNDTPDPDPDPEPGEQLTCPCWDELELSALKTIIGPNPTCFDFGSATSAAGAQNSIYAEGAGFCQIFNAGKSFMDGSLTAAEGQVCQTEIRAVCGL